MSEAHLLRRSTAHAPPEVVRVFSDIALVGIGMRRSIVTISSPGDEPVLRIAATKNGRFAGVQFVHRRDIEPLRKAIELALSPTFRGHEETGELMMKAARGPLRSIRFSAVVRPPFAPAIRLWFRLRDGSPACKPLMLSTRNGELEALAAAVRALVAMKPEAS